jgi:hypothetical protein
MAWLGEELPEKEQDGRTPFSPRCLKDVVEEQLFAHRRDLLTRLDLVFMDTIIDRDRDRVRRQTLHRPLRSAPRPAASLSLRAAGVALPLTVRDATAS